MPPGADLFAINLFVGLASPLVGSAAAAASARFAEGKAWGMSPSVCPNCGRRLGVLELVPMVSWLALRGKCSGCSAPISPSYPLIELAAVAIAVWAWLATPAHVFAVTCIYGWLLLTLSVIDIRTLRLPNALTAALLLAGLGTAQLLYPERLVEHLLGAVIGLVSLLTVELVYRHVRKRDGLGRGDSKLLGAIGAWIGPAGLPWCIFVAATAAIIWVLIIGWIRRRPVASDTAIPFGPFLAAGGWAVWVNGSVPF
jgi:leader peptidase (prepilin peptidase)/N-methyltransferase